MCRYFLFLLFFFPGTLLSAQSNNSTLNIEDLSEDARASSFEYIVQQRTRYEYLSHSFRPYQTDSDQILALRTRLQATYKRNLWSLTGELIDSRQYLASEASPINNGIVNTFALVQAYVRFYLQSEEEHKASGYLDLGRFTQDLGSRRLIARNGYRNTINNFTGIRRKWLLQSEMQLQAFFVFPVQRLPRQLDPLLDNQSQFDKEAWHTQFWGLFVKAPHLSKHFIGEFALLGLHEQDRQQRASKNRRLLNPTIRIYKKATKGQLDYQLESVFQIGTSRASSSPTDLQDLQHFAHFQHLELGYTLDHSWAPRFLLQLDYASGDRNPNDKQNNHFETLFGARRFDFGPTSIYGAFARSNILSPGIRLSAQAHPKIDVMLSNRLFWLASATDTFTTTGLRDPEGTSGSFLGNQIEGRIQWQALPERLNIEMGFAYLSAGTFRKNLTISQDETLQSPTYFYLQSTFSF